MIGFLVSPQSFVNEDISVHRSETIFDELLEEGILEHSSVKLNKPVTVNNIADEIFLPSATLLDFIPDYYGKNDGDGFPKVCKKLKVCSQESLWDMLVDKKLFTQEMKLILIDRASFQKLDKKELMDLELDLNNKDHIYLNVDFISYAITSGFFYVFEKNKFKDCMGDTIYNQLKAKHILLNARKAVVDKNPINFSRRPSCHTLDAEVYNLLCVSHIEAKNILSHLVTSNIIKKINDTYELSVTFEEIDNITLPLFCRRLVDAVIKILKRIFKYAFTTGTIATQRNKTPSEGSTPPKKCGIVRPATVAKETDEDLEEKIKKLNSIRSLLGKANDAAKNITSLLRQLRSPMKAIKAPNYELSVQESTLDQLFDSGHKQLQTIYETASKNFDEEIEKHEVILHLEKVYNLVGEEEATKIVSNIIPICVPQNTIIIEPFSETKLHQTIMTMNKDDLDVFTHKLTNVILNITPNNTHLKYITTTIQKLKLQLETKTSLMMENYFSTLDNNYREELQKIRRQHIDQPHKSINYVNCYIRSIYHKEVLKLLHKQSDHYKLFAAMIRENIPMDITCFPMLIPILTEYLNSIKLLKLTIVVKEENSIGKFILNEDVKDVDHCIATLVLQNNYFYISDGNNIEHSFEQTSTGLYEAIVEAIPALKNKLESFNKTLAEITEKEHNTRKTQKARLSSSKVTDFDSNECETRQSKRNKQSSASGNQSATDGGDPNDPNDPNRQEDRKNERQTSTDESDMSSEEEEKEKSQIKTVSTHYADRIIRLIRLAGIIQRIAEEEHLQRNELFQPGPSEFQATNSERRGNETHSAHIVTGNSINPCIGTNEQYRAGTSSGNYNELRNVLGHTQIVPRYANIGQVGRVFDTFIGDALDILGDFNFNKGVGDGEHIISERKQFELYKTKLIKRLLGKNSKHFQEDHRKLIIFLLDLTLEMFLQYGYEGYIGEKTIRYRINKRKRDKK